jgi:hypothetical protein
MKGWGFYILAAIGFVVYGATMDVDREMDVDRDDSSAIVDGGTVNAFGIRVGDCFNDAGTFDDQIVSDPIVPCSEPHDNETYAVIDVSFDSYPADGSMDQLAEDACMVHFESFAGKKYEVSPLVIATISPSAVSWGQGNREVVCAVYDVKAKQLVGSMAARAL